jgi:hypothetical protein
MRAIAMCKKMCARRPGRGADVPPEEPVAAAPEGRRGRTMGRVLAASMLAATVLVRKLRARKRSRGNGGDGPDTPR